MVISASRRTDIPSFYTGWIKNRLQAGYVCVRNPVNTRQVSFIPLSPDTVDCFVFWTKDVSPMLCFLPELDRMGYCYTFQFTLTPYGSDIERRLPDKAQIIRGFQDLSRHIGPERIVWRYDPVIISPEWPVSRHLSQFDALCQALSGCTKQCILSFIDLYRKTLRNAAGIVPGEVSRPDRFVLAEGMAHIAARHGIKISTCCEPDDFSRFGIGHGACIDPALIETVSGRIVSSRKDPNQRKGCLCAASTDIGAYDSCTHGCAYCYANVSETAVRRNIQNHDPLSPFLIGGPRQNDIVKEKKVKKQEQQISLFGE